MKVIFRSPAPASEQYHLPRRNRSAVTTESHSAKGTSVRETQPTQDFLKALLRSQLLNRDLVREFFSQLPAETQSSPEKVSEAFIRAGHLTRFQAGKLLQGISRGLKLGHFSILSPIAKGGTATVYLAMDLVANRLVAVKVLPPNQAKEPRRLARFLREMRLSAQTAAHTHIVPVHESGQIEGIFYLAMEFIPGRSLHRMVQDEGQLSLHQVALIGMEAALALHHIHLVGLVHRDIKPANILISSRGQVRLIDFGLAMLQGERTGDESVVGGQGFIVGTMDFIAPEQTIDPSKVDGRADIYSLGCTLYFALTGKPPFQGGTNIERMKRHRHEEPEPLASLRPDLPGGFVSLIKTMMDKNPDQRIQQAGLLAADLKLWTPGEHEFSTSDESSDEVMEQVGKLKMYQPEEVTELERQLLADDTGSEPGIDAKVEMSAPTEEDVVISQFFSGNKQLIMSGGQDQGSGTLFQKGSRIGPALSATVMVPVATEEKGGSGQWRWFLLPAVPLLAFLTWLFFRIVWK